MRRITPLLHSGTSPSRATERSCVEHGCHVRATRRIAKMKKHHGCTISPWVTVAGTALYSATWQRTWHYSKKQASHGVFVHVHNRCPSMPQPQPRSTSTTRMMRRIPHSRVSDPRPTWPRCPKYNKTQKKIELLGGCLGCGRRQTILFTPSIGEGNGSEAGDGDCGFPNRQEKNE